VRTERSTGELHPELLSILRLFDSRYNGNYLNFSIK